jgi:HK97 family phage portal protein
MGFWGRFTSGRRALGDQVAALERQVGQIVNAASGQSGVYSLSDPNAYASLFGPQSGMTADRALTHAVVYRCVFLIASAVTMLPLQTWRSFGKADQDLDENSPQARLLGERPNRLYSSAGLWRSVLSDMLLKGNGIIWIERNGAGIPQNLYWIPWGRAGTFLFDNPVSGGHEVGYYLTLDNGRQVIATCDDVMHFGGSPRWNILFYESPITAYAQTVGIAIASDAYAKAYFDNSSSPDNAISYPGSLTGKADEIRDKITERFGASNRFKGPLILDGGADIKQLRMNAADTQLIETRALNTDQIGMIFGVPSHLLNQTSKATSFGKGLEEMTQAFIDFSIGPHLAMIEAEINAKMFGQRTRRAVFDRDGFVRGDLKSRSEAITTLLGGAQGPGVISRNDGRRKLGLPPRKEAEYDEILGWGPPATPGDAIPKPAAKTPEPEPDDPPADPPPAKSRRGKK